MLDFTLATVDKVLFEGTVFSVTAPGSAGELTVLLHHTPLITTLKKGTVKIRAQKDSDLKEIEISGGLLETSGNRATILI